MKIASCFRPFAAAFLTAALLAFFCPQSVYAQEQSEDEQLEMLIEQQFEGLTSQYKLDEVQQFYLDSILQHDYRKMYEELQQMRKTGANSNESYTKISQKWQDMIDDALQQRVFTPEQWEKYMKSAYGKEKQKRQKKQSR